MQFAADSPKVPEDKAPQASDNERTSSDSGERRGSKKRSKHEVEGMESPEVEKRQKRNASVKAQSIITKQVCPSTWIGAITHVQNLCP